MNQNLKNLWQKRRSQPPAARDKHLKSGIVGNFGDNAINGIVAFEAQGGRAGAGLSIGSTNVVA
jgi:hypothetical protein